MPLRINLVEERCADAHDEEHAHLTQPERKGPEADERLAPSIAPRLTPAADEEVDAALLLLQREDVAWPIALRGAAVEGPHAPQHLSE